MCVPPPSRSFSLSLLLPLFLSPSLPPSFCPLSSSSLPSLFSFSLSPFLSPFHFPLSSVGNIIDQLTDLGQAGRGCSALHRLAQERRGVCPPGSQGAQMTRCSDGGGTKEPVASSCPISVAGTPVTAASSAVACPRHSGVPRPFSLCLFPASV